MITINPKVSVCITTYNHEKFIDQALEGALMQQTNFEFEIIVGEDDSSDRTREIVKSYKRKYPDKVKLFLNDRKNVIYVNGRPTGRWNFVNTFKHTDGQYVALVEGDDFWTYPLKLQRQVEYLENHPEVVICFHNVNVIYDSPPTKSHLFYVDKPDHVNMQTKPKPLSTLRDLVRGNYIQTPSVMFKNGLFSDFPDWYFKLDRGDWPLHILNAQHGDIGYIDETWASYRVHSGGIYTSKTRIEQLEGAINTANEINKHFGYRYTGLMRRANAIKLADIVQLLYLNEEYERSYTLARKYLMRYALSYGRGKAMLSIMVNSWLHSRR